MRIGNSCLRRFGTRASEVEAEGWSLRGRKTSIVVRVKALNATLNDLRLFNLDSVLRFFILPIGSVSENGVEVENTQQRTSMTINKQ